MQAENKSDRVNYEKLVAKIAAGDQAYHSETYPKVLSSINKQFLLDVPYEAYKSKAGHEIELLRSVFDSTTVHLLDFVGDSATKAMPGVNGVDLLMLVKRDLTNQDFYRLVDKGYTFIGLSPFFKAYNDVLYFIKPLSSVKHKTDPAFVTLHIANKHSDTAFKILNNRRLFNNNPDCIDELKQRKIAYVNKHKNLNDLETYHGLCRLEIDYIIEKFNSEEFLRKHSNMSEQDMKRYLQ